MNRGFTLIELLTLSSVIGIVAAGGFAYHLEAKTSVARSEARVAMTREASLVAELMSRDLRAATSVTTEPDGRVVVKTPSGAHTYAVSNERLTRDGKVWARAVDTLSVRVDPQLPRRWSVDLRLSKYRHINREVAIERTFWVGARR